MDAFEAPNPECDYVLKVIMVGDSGVGKSCLLKAFMGDPFQQGHTSTIGVDFEIKAVIADGQTVNLQIWDTAGQERFRTITTAYYRSCDAVMMVFDVTDSLSFKNLAGWYDDVKSYARENVDIMLLGNKVDLDDERAIPSRIAQQFAEMNNMMYMETSAKELINVEKAFTTATIAAVATKRKLEGDYDDEEEEEEEEEEVVEEAAPAASSVSASSSNSASASNRRAPGGKKKTKSKKNSSGSGSSRKRQLNKERRVKRNKERTVRLQKEMQQEDGCAC